MEADRVAGLRLMRRVTQWTLIAVAALRPILAARVQFVTRDLSPLGARRPRVAAGLRRRRPVAADPGRDGGLPGRHAALVWRWWAAAAVVALVLWGARSRLRTPPWWMWALPFSSLVAAVRVHRAQPLALRRRHAVAWPRASRSGFAASGNRLRGLVRRSGGCSPTRCPLRRPGVDLGRHAAPRQGAQQARPRSPSCASGCASPATCTTSRAISCRRSRSRRSSRRG